MPLTLLALAHPAPVSQHLSHNEHAWVAVVRLAAMRSCAGEFAHAHCPANGSKTIIGAAADAVML